MPDVWPPSIPVDAGVNSPPRGGYLGIAPPAQPESSYVGDGGISVNTLRFADGTPLQFSDGTYLEFTV